MHDETVNLTGGDLNMVWELAGVKPCSLEIKPGDKDNWIERAGGSLPNYICRVAKGVMRTGKSRSAAIAIAVSRIKKWAAGGDDVNADTRAKAAAALAQWEALKAKAKAKKIIKASASDGSEYIILSNVDSYSLDAVRDAWENNQRISRQILSQESGPEVAEIAVPYGYVREVYTDFIIVSFEGTKNAFYRVPYTTDSNGVNFGEPSPVELMYVSTEDDWRTAARR